MRENSTGLRNGDVLRGVQGIYAVGERVWGAQYLIKSTGAL